MNLEYSIKHYIQERSRGNTNASIEFIKNTILGLEHRPKGLKQFIILFMGNSHHLWMWDKESLKKELADAGFVSIRDCMFNDCEDKMFILVEDKERFTNAVSIECKK